MIDILPDDEEAHILASVAEVATGEFPLDRLRTPQGGTLTEAQWALAAEMGWIGLSLDTAQGGIGLDVAVEALAHRAFGRQLMSPSLIATAILAHLSADGGGQADCLAGRRHGAFALDRGQDLLMIDAVAADAVLMPSGTGYVRLGSDDFTAGAMLDGLDPTLPLAQGKRAGTGVAVPERAVLHIGLLLAAALSGMADAAAQMATDYAKIRQQFGKPIGAFQAIGHACADAAMRSEAAHAQVLFAAIALRDRHPDAHFQVASAARVAGQAAFANATMNIHTHGGMGYSAECQAHIYLKRTVLLQRLTAPLTGDSETLLGQGAIIA